MTTTRSEITMFDQVDERFVDHVHTQGFAVLADALSAAEVEAVNAEALKLCRSNLSSLKRGQEAATTNMNDDDALRRYVAIHHPDKVSTVLRAMISQMHLVDALTAVIGPDVKAMQSMLFIKSEGKPGQAWHQDEFFIPSRDRSLYAAWIALDDATVDNGCLWVLPGSHRPGIIYPTERQNDPEEFGCTIQAHDFPYDEADAVPVEIPAGSVLIFNGYLLHRSLRNSGSRGYRRAVVNHYMSCSSLLPWQMRDNEKAGWADYRDIVLVAGKDPYAYKGIEDRRRPHIRPDGDSGCDN